MLPYEVCISAFIYLLKSQQTNIHVLQILRFKVNSDVVPRPGEKPLRYERGETLPPFAAQRFISVYWNICQVISICHGPESSTTCD